MHPCIDPGPGNYPLGSAHCSRSPPTGYSRHGYVFRSSQNHRRLGLHRLGPVVWRPGRAVPLRLPPFFNRPRPGNKNRPASLSSLRAPIKSSWPPSASSPPPPGAFLPAQNKSPFFSTRSPSPPSAPQSPRRFSLTACSTSGTRPLRLPRISPPPRRIHGPLFAPEHLFCSSPVS